MWFGFLLWQCLLVCKVTHPFQDDVLPQALQRGRYLDATALEDRPQVILWECVSKLSSLRVSKVKERGTEVVQEACAQRGYITQFQNLDSSLDKVFACFFFWLGLSDDHFLSHVANCFRFSWTSWAKDGLDHVALDF